MCKRNMDRLPLTCPQLGTWPTTQACALTGNRTGQPFGLQDDAQSTEPHQSGWRSSLNMCFQEILRYKTNSDCFCGD